MTPRKPSARGERDEKIVAEAGPWYASTNESEVNDVEWCVYPRRQQSHEKQSTICEALARVANRLAKRVRRTR